MITFTDAKLMVESLFGEIQGYKALSWNHTGDNYNLVLGNNYIFVGEIYVTSFHGSDNIVSVGLWDNNICQVIANATGIGNSAIATVIGKDVKDNNDSFIDNSASQYPQAVIVTGWLFQVNK